VASTTKCLRAAAGHDRAARAVGAKIGILMAAPTCSPGDRRQRSIVAQFQKECSTASTRESRVRRGHASRCAYSPFARDFFRQRLAMRRSGVPAEERRRLLDELILALAHRLQGPKA